MTRNGAGRGDCDAFVGLTLNNARFVCEVEWLEDLVNIIEYRVRILERT